MVEVVDLPISEVASRGFRPDRYMRYILLEQNINENGFNRDFPIVVCKGNFAHGKKYKVLNGNHRFYICFDLGYKTIPCIIEEDK